MHHVRDSNKSEEQYQEDDNNRTQFPVQTMSAVNWPDGADYRQSPRNNSLTGCKNSAKAEYCPAINTPLGELQFCEPTVNETEANSDAYVYSSSVSRDFLPSVICYNCVSSPIGELPKNPTCFVSHSVVIWIAIYVWIDRACVFFLYTYCIVRWLCDWIYPVWIKASDRSSFHDHESYSSK